MKKIYIYQPNLDLEVISRFLALFYVVLPLLTIWSINIVRKVIMGRFGVLC